MQCLVLQFTWILPDGLCFLTPVVYSSPVDAFYTLCLYLLLFCHVFPLVCLAFFL